MLLLAGTIVLATGGAEVLTQLFGTRVFLVPTDQDWRYLAVKDAPYLAIVLMTFLSAPLPEELIFRGLPLALVLGINRHAPHSRYLRPIICAIIIGGFLAMFADIHSDSGDLNVLTAAWSGAVYFAVAFLTRSLWIPIAAHFFNNLFVFGQWLGWWQL